jgi:hypothetical protein
VGGKENTNETTVCNEDQICDQFQKLGAEAQHHPFPKMNNYCRWVNDTSWPYFYPRISLLDQLKNFFGADFLSGKRRSRYGWPPPDRPFSYEETVAWTFAGGVYPSPEGFSPPLDLRLCLYF